MKLILLNWIKFFFNLIKKYIPNSLWKENRDYILSRYDQMDNSFNSYGSLPKYASKTQKKIFFHNQEKYSVGIVLQGPILETDDFTIETVKLYKKIFPEHKIIVSTWKNANSYIVDSLIIEGAIVIQSEFPSNYGPRNINLLIESTRNGLKKIREMGVDYVYKTRTDQRMNVADITNGLINLINLFPISHEYIGINKRLVACNYTTLKYRPYGIGDMFMFGLVDDMLMYWDVPFDNRLSSENPSVNEISKMTVSQYAKLRISETYICTSFLKKMNIKCDYTLSHSLSIYRDLFCFVDYQQIGLFWYKYDWRNDTKFYFTKDHTYELFNNIDWLSLQTNSIKLDDFNKALDSMEGNEVHFENDSLK